MAGEIVSGIDVGGTFTDLILIDGATAAGPHRQDADDPRQPGLRRGFGAGDTGFPVADIDLIVHGTTTTTNAVLERRLARTGMITTRGFRDVIELGRRTRPQPYGMTGRFAPVIPRNLRLEVSERVEASGRVRTPLDEDEMRAARATLIAAGCESLVIHFLHSYANPAHELRAAEIAAELWPNGYITTGHSLLSEAREFERGVTAAVNASVQPILERYVERLREELAGQGLRARLPDHERQWRHDFGAFVTREAAKTVMSGPASGVIAAAYTGRRAGTPNLVTYDMGGTSTDVALIRNAEPAVSNETEIEYAHADPRADGGRPHGRRRRRLDRARRCLRADPGRAGKRGRQSRARSATAAAARSHHHRRQPGARAAPPKSLLSVDHPVSVSAVREIFARQDRGAHGLDGVAAAGAVLGSAT